MGRNTNLRASGTLFIWYVFLWTCALALVFATPTTQGASDAADAAAIQSNLPANVTLQQASIKQVAAALHETILQHPNDALDILRIAILAKTPRRGDGDRSCKDRCQLVQAACTAALDRTSKLVELASSLCPDCADSLQNLLVVLRNDRNGVESRDVIGFGVGFGPGLPGAPSFVGPTANGSAVGGPLPPPSPPPITPVANN